jgi:methionyl-tRNA synthetase
MKKASRASFDDEYVNNVRRRLTAAENKAKKEPPVEVDTRTSESSETEGKPRDNSAEEAAQMAARTEFVKKLDEATNVLRDAQGLVGNDEQRWSQVFQLLAQLKGSAESN